MTTLIDALRRKYSTPQVFLRSLGLDAAIPKARDDEPAPSAIAGMIALRDRMSPEGFRALCNELCGGEAEDGEFATPEERADEESFPAAKRASDEPPFFKGRPKTGGAMDGVSLAFDKLSTPRRTKVERSFSEMFPGAGDIKLNDFYPSMSRVRT
jgi:hypothetical protein